MQRQIASSMLCAGVIAFGASGSALARETIELKVSMFSPPTNVLNREFIKIASELETKTKGRLKLNIFHTGQLGPPPRQYDLVRTGVADFSLVMAGLTPGRFPLSELVIMPGVSPSALVGGRAMVEMADDVAKEFAGMRVLAILPTSTNPLYTKNEIRKLSDLKSLRIRHPGPLQAAAIAMLGAVPVAVSPSETGDALARGQIDGVAAGTGGVLTMKWHESLRYVIKINMGSQLFSVVMNADSYAKLPDDFKAVVNDTIAKPDRWNRAIDESEAADYETLIREGVKEVKLSDAEVSDYNASLKKLWEDVVADLDKKGLPARAYFTKLQAAIAKNVK